MKKAVAFILTLPLLLAVGSADSQCPPGTYPSVTIQQVQLGLGVAIGDTLLLDNVVVTALHESGWIVQEPGATADPFSGLFIFQNASPGALFEIGDLVDVIGPYSEFFEKSEFRIDGGRGCITKVGVGVAPPPVLLPACDINDSLTAPEAEKWESVVVQTDSVIVIVDGNFGSWMVEPFKGAVCGVNDTLQLDDEGHNPYAQPLVGDTLLLVTGFLDYNFNRYKLTPRGNFDISFSGAPPPPNTRFCYPTDDTHIEVVFDRGLDATSAGNAANYFIEELDITITGASIDSTGSTLVTLTTLDMSSFRDTLNIRTLNVSNVANDSGVVMTAPNTEIFVPGVKNCDIVQNNTIGLTDTTIFHNINIAVAGIVTATAAESFNNRHVFIQDRTGFGYGLDIQTENFAPIATIPLARGDSVIVAGQGDDFFLYTNINPVDAITIVNSGNPVPTPVVVDIATAKTEAYEGKLVRLNDLQVKNASPDAPNDFGEFVIIDTSGVGDTLRVDDIFSPGITPYGGLNGEVQTGDLLTFLQGPMYHSFGFRKLEPRDPSDFELLAQVGVDNPNSTPRPATFLGQNRPNPFNPTTSIEFSLGSKSHVELGIYDLSGRKVRSLLSKTLAAGDYTLANGRAATWDGRTDDGKEVSSGVYFYRLETDDHKSTKKMVLVR